MFNQKNIYLKRIISKYAIPGLKRRIKTVPLPEQIALNQTLNLTK